MNADREPNRLPLRAGAMLLFAVAVVFLGLGWHSAVSSGDDGQTAAEVAAPTTAQTTAAPTTPQVAAASKSLCVYNVGETRGLAAEVTATLKQSGYRVKVTTNYSGGTFSENTVFYDGDAEKAQAEKINQTLGGGYSLEKRPDGFTRCSDGVAVMAFEPSGSGESTSNEPG